MIRKIIAPIILSAIFGWFLVSRAMAQNLPAMGIPLSTTIVVSKPAPGQTYGDSQLITFGVGDKHYKYILKDAYVDSRKYRWPDIWQYVNQFQPNMVVQGPNADQIATIKPGETATIKGMFAAMDRTFEVMSVQESGAEAPSHY